ncbi:MAG: hypothetical protein JSV61_14855 [Anaerolineales bacterium]|nr:MAG: hypothetical protein JSV61_14855 [Anaerolineales bacterium]
MTSDKRPRSLSILTFLVFLQGVGFLAYGIYVISLEGWFTRGSSLLLSRFSPFVLINATSYNLVVILSALLLLLVGISLRRTKRWAWTAAISVQGLGLLFALLEYSNQRPNFIGMLFGIAIVIYLNQSEVQEILRGQIPEKHV